MGLIIMVSDGPHGSFGKKALNHKIFIIGFLKFVERAPALITLFSWVQSSNSGKETAQASLHEWYCNTPKEWFCEAIQKLPRRWVIYIYIAEEANMLSWKLFNYQPNSNRVPTNE